MNRLKMPRYIQWVVLTGISFLFGTIRPLHPFEKKLGRRLSFFTWTILLIVFVIFYTVDFANYAYLFQRLRANLLNLLEDTKTSLGLIWENYHVILIVVVLIVIIVSLLDFISMLYKTILSKPKLTTKRSRITWG